MRIPVVDNWIDSLDDYSWFGIFLFLVALTSPILYPYFWISDKFQSIKDRKEGKSNLS